MPAGLASALKGGGGTPKRYRAQRRMYSPAAEGSDVFAVNDA
jgi:hypothetical protein